MKIRHFFGTMLAGMALFMIGVLVGKSEFKQQQPTEEGTTTRETTVDTITHRAPEARAERVLGTQRYVLPTYRFGGGVSGEPLQCRVDSTFGTGAGGEPRCSKDSAILELPVLQRHYADSTYEAWVSGPVNPQLDSIRVFARQTIITKREWKPPKRWHIGVTAGYGYGAKGFQPYVGVGITYSIFSF